MVELTQNLGVPRTRGTPERRGVWTAAPDPTPTARTLLTPAKFHHCPGRAPDGAHAPHRRSVGPRPQGRSRLRPPTSPFLFLFLLLDLVGSDIRGKETATPVEELHKLHHGVLFGRVSQGCPFSPGGRTRRVSPSPQSGNVTSRTPTHEQFATTTKTDSDPTTEHKARVLQFQPESAIQSMSHATRDPSSLPQPRSDHRQRGPFPASKGVLKLYVPPVTLFYLSLNTLPSAFFFCHDSGRVPLRTSAPEYRTWPLLMLFGEIGVKLTCLVFIIRGVNFFRVIYP